MTKLKVTQKIQGNFGELLFEHFCQKNNYAYISLEEIYNTLTPRNLLKLRFGDRRIPVRIPNNIVGEIREFSIPINQNEMKPNYVFDFLTVSLKFSFLKENDKIKQQPFLTDKAFNWIEIKTGKAKLSKSQREYKEKSRIGLRLFRIKTSLPTSFEVNSQFT